jgi:uncharacterized membrane protein
MTEAAIKSAGRFGVTLDSVVITLLSGTIALGAALSCYAVLHVSLGTVFSSVFMVGLISIAFGESARTLLQAVILSIVLAIASTMPILLALVDRPTTIGATFQLLLLCMVVGLFLLTFTQLLSHFLGHAIAAAVVLIVWLAWMTWPVWMSQAFATPIGVWTIDHLFVHQPLMAISGAFPQMGDWSHTPFAYKYLTNLGQDVLYARPTSAWSAIVSHGVLAIVLLFLEVGTGRRLKRAVVSRPVSASPVDA